MYLFTWSSNYLLRAELTKRKNWFAEKFGAHNITVIQAADFTPSKAIEALVGWGLFADKKLVIIYGIPWDLDPANKISISKIEPFEAQITKLQSHIPDTTTVVFVSNKPDKRTKSYKTFSTLCTVKSFDPTKDQELSLIKELLGNLTTSTLTSYLAHKVGTDLDRIAHECHKILDYMSIHPELKLTEDLIDLLCFGEAIADNFKLFHYRLDSATKALSLITIAQQEGIFWTEFAGGMYYSLKVLLQIADCMNHDITSPKEIGNKLWLSSFVLNQWNNKLHLIHSHQQRLTTIYCSLMELDIAIKTGITPEAHFWLSVKDIMK